LVERIAWQPCSPHLTPLDFFLWKFLKDRVLVEPLLAYVVEFRTLSIAAVVEVKPEMIHSMWQEIYYRWDVCHITSGSHTEP
jgi:hypothetical protein